MNFWDFEVWGAITLIALLLSCLLIANIIKKVVPFLRESLVPTSVLGGLLLLAVAIPYELISGTSLFNTDFFGGNGTDLLEILTFHCLALGFIASTFTNKKGTFTKKQANEIFNTGVTTVSSYLLQGILGMAITLIAALIITDFFPASGILLPFGYGQGTGQAMNYGNIYENDYGFVGGKSFGLTIAAFGFLSASFGGIIHLSILRRKGKASAHGIIASRIQMPIEEEDEISMSGSIDKTTIQIALIFVSYLIAYLIIFGLGQLIPSFKSVLYGFNFLIGVLTATLIKFLLDFFKKKNIIKKQYINRFLMARISGFFFDLMILAGIAAIRIQLLSQYWVVLLLLAIVGALSTYFYNRFVAKKLFSEYTEHQFLAMYGMLTGTASTGIVLLREIDPNFESPAASNLVYQNFPAMIFGFPMMLLATLAPKQPLLTLGILVAFFLVMNLILFRSYLFKSRKKA